MNTRSASRIGRNRTMRARNDVLERCKSARASYYFNAVAMHPILSCILNLALGVRRDFEAEVCPKCL